MCEPDVVLLSVILPTGVHGGVMGNIIIIM